MAPTQIEFLVEGGQLKVSAGVTIANPLGVHQEPERSWLLA